MFKNYLKIAWRNLFKDKLYSLINIIGLSIGITSCALIYLYVSYELSYDSYHHQSENIYRMISSSHEPDKVKEFAPTSPIMARSALENFAEVEKIVRFNGSSRNISYEQKKFYDTKIHYADSTLLDVFDFDLIQGDKRTILNKPYSVVLTESAAKKYFGNENAYGKIMKLSDTINLTVTGVIRDIPKNSHFSFECFLSRNTMDDMNKADSTWYQNNELNWFNCNTFSYLRLKDGTDPAKLKAKINAYMTKENEEIRKQTGMYMNCDLQPLTSIHLNSHLEAEFKDSKNGNIQYIYIFIGTAILMLVIACCNFINLSTAKSINRSKEIGLRKVIGATRKQLIAQFLGESVLFALIGSLISILFVISLLPVFNSFVGIELHFNSSILLIYLIIIICVGLLSGSYPALLMSSFSPIRSIKGSIKHSLSDIIFRKGLVIFQFSIAVALIICTIIVLNQMDFIQNKNIGMNKDQLLNIELKNQDAAKSDVIISELRKNPKIVSASVNSFSFKFMSNITLVPEGLAENKLTSCNVFSTDHNFFKTYQIPFVAGRDFSPSFQTDETSGFIVNEAAVKEFGWKTAQNAIGKNIQWGLGKEGKVIGVVKDFNFSTLKDNIKPVLMHIFKPWYSNITVRLKTQNVSTTISEIGEIWKTSAPHSPYKYSFVEDDFNSMFQSELKMRAVLGVFTFLSILVACLGLFGLAAFTIKQRVREIGIRKVLGSSVRGIVTQLSKDFLRLVFISIIISIPIAWYTSYKWLEDFAFRINISIWVFIGASFLAVCIALITVSTQALKAAWANPVKSLRSE